MPWFSKEHPSLTSFFLIPGLQELHGDIVAKQYQERWVAKHKYPLLHFPSGITRELLYPTEHPAQINVWGEINIPLELNRDDAYRYLQTAAEQFQYPHQIVSSGKDKLIILNSEGNRGYHLQFDNEKRQLIDIVHVPTWAMEVLDGESRAVLPPLYSTEKLGDQVIAPIKLFTPDSNWSWYPTEFDGNDLFFGLVSGYEVEAGYFSLVELEEARGPLNLPIERDLYYVPKTLAELRTSLHE